MFRALSSLRTLCALWEQEVPGLNPGAPTHTLTACSRCDGHLAARLRFAGKSRRFSSNAAVRS